MSDHGHIELERRVGSIVVGERHRRHPGDLSALMDSMKRVGLLQPVTISPDGYLICGYRRLEAAKSLGWDTLRVWVRSGISDDLTRLLAERDENLTHQPLAADEAAKLYEELLVLVKEDAERRKKATQYGSPTSNSAGGPVNDSAGRAGPADSAGPVTVSLGDARRRAAEMVTGKASYARLEQILEMERIAADKSGPLDTRKVAEAELEAIRNGGAVDPGYQRLKAAQRQGALMKPSADPDIGALADEVLAQARTDRARGIKENRAKRASAAAHAKRSPRSFTLTWTELDGWSKKYDVEQIAREVKPDDWALFIRVLDETMAFAEAVNLARE
jgi:ParB family chromosome partitioning protein